MILPPFSTTAEIYSFVPVVASLYGIVRTESCLSTFFPPSVSKLNPFLLSSFKVSFHSVVSVSSTPLSASFPTALLCFPSTAGEVNNTLVVSKLNAGRVANSFFFTSALLISPLSSTIQTSRISIPLLGERSHHFPGLFPSVAILSLFVWKYVSASPTDRKNTLSPFRAYSFLGWKGTWGAMFSGLLSVVGLIAANSWSLRDFKELSPFSPLKSLHHFCASLPCHFLLGATRLWKGVFPINFSLNRKSPSSPIFVLVSNTLHWISLPAPVKSFPRIPNQIESVFWIFPVPFITVFLVLSAKIVDECRGITLSNIKMLSIILDMLFLLALIAICFCFDISTSPSFFAFWDFSLLFYVFCHNLCCFYLSEFSLLMIFWGESATLSCSALPLCYIWMQFALISNLSLYIFCIVSLVPKLVIAIHSRLTFTVYHILF